MTIRKRSILKQWFKRGAYPREEQFADWMDSYVHKEEDKLPISNVEGLADQLNAKYGNASGEALEKGHTELRKDFDLYRRATDTMIRDISDEIDSMDDMMKYESLAIIKPILGFRTDGLLDGDDIGIFLHPADDMVARAYFSFGPEGTPSFFDSDKTAWEARWGMIREQNQLPSGLSIQGFGILDFQHFRICAKDGLYYSAGDQKYYLVYDDGKKYSSFDRIPFTDSYSKPEADTLLSGKASLDHTHTEIDTMSDDIDNMHRYLMHIAMPITGLRPDGEFDDDGPGIYLRPADDVIDWGATISFGGVQPYDIYDDDQQQAWDEHWEKVKAALSLPSDLDVTDIGQIDDADDSTIAKDGLYYSLEDHKFYLVSDGGMKCSSFDSFPVTDFYTKKEADQLLSGKASLDHTHTDFRALEWQIETLSTKINDNLGGVRIACAGVYYSDETETYKLNDFRLLTYSEWSSGKYSSLRPLGVWVPIDGHRPIIVAPKVIRGSRYFFEDLKFTEYKFVPDKDYCSNESDAYNDFNRDAHRNHAIVHYASEKIYGTIAGMATSYNPFEQAECSKFFKWWIPTLGELMAIFRHLPEIDRCLTVMGESPIGYSPFITASAYISSTTYNYQDSYNEFFWILDFKTGLSGVRAIDDIVSALLVTSPPTYVLQE
ncbi:MAG: hypothetical protein HDS01_07610 [Bacteroides sp.]|nr:hypothetical protein [Bacteroides sp.]